MMLGVGCRTFWLRKLYSYTVVCYFVV